MNIGQLRHKVTIQKKEGGTNDGGGNITPNWVEVATVWAEVMPNAYEKTFANQSMQQTTHTVKMRYRSDVNNTMQLLFDNRILDIKYVSNTKEANKELVLSCLEG